MCDSTKIDFGDNVCRSCLTFTEDMKSLNDPYSPEMCLADVFTFITSLKCSGDNDVLPTQICHECFGELHSSYQFVSKSQESDKKLQAYLNKTNKTNEEIVADNTRIISDITITDCVRSVHATNLTAPTTMNAAPNMNDVKIEVNTLSNDFHLSTRPLPTVNGIKLEDCQSNCNIYGHTYEPINTLKTPEMQKDLNQEMELIKHDIDIDIKTDITNDINCKNSVEINGESANEQITSKMQRKSNKIANIIIADVNNENDSSVTFSEHVNTRMHARKYTCKICNKSFNFNSNLRRHERLHSGKKSHSCTLCNKSYFRKEDLVQHTRVHTGNMPYPCSFCDKSFNVSSKLVQHLRTHTGERPYLCTVCNKSFGVKDALVVHTRIHTGERPYSCTVCNKSFSRKEILNNHMLTHTGERPYSCTICSKSFSLKDTLVKHTLIHTNKRLYSCTNCNKTYHNIGYLNRHLRTHTKE